MKLGQKVKFSKSLSKNQGYGVNYQYMTEEQKRELEEYGYIKLERFLEREHKEKEGFVCGKRNIVTTAWLEEIENPYSEWDLVQTDDVFETVYVIACDMRGLYRVREDDLEVIE
ncbi:hypothetical protein SAMN05421676_11240 [Salinibacillus kushneri]|uniref:Uncharacterized protein n=1 Tax=Salinibacillus kushneri TaxID=237682 RepID=A0A1I0IEK6_9BACI|nr:hypothetical protein [Salinibacillus kushneri]SET95299.1 hypothetical protein SAMN05421676_11240 [Salinibacillus kushneri]